MYLLCKQSLLLLIKVMCGSEQLGNLNEDDYLPLSHHVLVDDWLVSFP